MRQTGFCNMMIFGAKIQTFLFWKVEISKSKHLISKHRKDSRKVKTVVHMYCSEQIICILLSCFCISLRKEGGCYLALVPLCQGDIEEEAEEDCEVSHDIYWLASLLLAEGLFEPPFWRNVTGVHNYVEYSIDAKNWQAKRHKQREEFWSFKEKTHKSRKSDHKLDFL